MAKGRADTPMGSGRKDGKMNIALRRILWKLMLYVLLWAVPMAAQAAPTTFYIRAGATGNGSGTDWTNAYGSLPSTLQRGATYYIADGTYPGYTLDDPVSGMELITVKKATVADHGTSVGWSDSFGDGQAVFPSIMFSTSYYVFDGVTGGGPGNWDSGFGFEITSTPPNSCRDNGNLITFGPGASFVTVRHSHIHAGSQPLRWSGCQSPRKPAGSPRCNCTFGSPAS